MLGVSDSQLRSIWAAATGLPIEKRGVFLGRLIAQLQLCGSHFTTADIDDAVRLAPDPKIGSLMEARRFPPPRTVEEAVLCGQRSRRFCVSQT